MAIQIIAGGNSQFPMVYMNMMDVPTYLWYEATQKTLIVGEVQKRPCGSRTAGRVARGL